MTPFLCGLEAYHQGNASPKWDEPKGCLTCVNSLAVARAWFCFSISITPQTTFILWYADHGPGCFWVYLLCFVTWTLYHWKHLTLLTDIYGHFHSIEASIYIHAVSRQIKVQKLDTHSITASIFKYECSEATSCMSCAFVSPDWDEITKDKWGRKWRGQPDGEKQVRQDATSFS